MNINLNSITYKGKCETCKNESICKYSEEFKKIIDATGEIVIGFSNHFTVNAICDKYEKRTERQDGFQEKSLQKLADGLSTDMPKEMQR